MPQVSEDIDWTRKPVIGRVEAMDADTDLNALLYYSIIGGNTLNQFSVNEDTGELSVTKQLDHETTKNYRLVIRAQDRGSPTRSNTTQVRSLQRRAFQLQTVLISVEFFLPEGSKLYLLISIHFFCYSVNI